MAGLAAEVVPGKVGLQGECDKILENPPTIWTFAPTHLFVVAAEAFLCVLHEGTGLLLGRADHRLAESTRGCLHDRERKSERDRLF
jgi:hypothetical protein